MSSWSDPNTHVWSVGELVNAATLNVFHRDNLNATVHRYVAKTADESRTSSTPTADGELFFAVPANSIWFVQFHLAWFSATAGTMAMDFSAPASANFQLTSFRGTGSIRWYETASGGGTQGSYGGSVGATANLRGAVEVGATAGNFTLLWGGDSNATILRAGSYGMVTRHSP